MHVSQIEQLQQLQQLEQLEQLQQLPQLVVVQQLQQLQQLEQLQQLIVRSPHTLTCVDILRVLWWRIYSCPLDTCMHTHAPSVCPSGHSTRRTNACTSEDCILETSPTIYRRCMPAAIALTDLGAHTQIEQLAQLKQLIVVKLVVIIKQLQQLQQLIVIKLVVVIQQLQQLQQLIVRIPHGVLCRHVGGVWLRIFSCHSDTLGAVCVYA